MMSQPTSRPTTIYLVRHGESQLNLEKRVSGQFDTPLSQEGIRHSQMLAVQLLQVPLTGIYTSALRRTVETAGDSFFLVKLTFVVANQLVRG